MSTLDGAGPADPNLKTYTLQAEHELRIESSTKLTVTLTQGSAELYGTELLVDKLYTFTHECKFAIYTWHGCILNVHGQPTSIYTSNETPMISYINTHAALQNLRKKAADVVRVPGVYAQQGPRALIVGAHDSGKTTLCKILLNYAVRQLYQPIYIDLDPANNHISVPGSIAATVVDQPIDLTLADQYLQIKQPLCYYYGHVNTLTAVEIYERQITALSELITERCNTVEQSRISGCIIKMSSNVERMVANNNDTSSKSGYDLVVHTANVFNCDVVIVLGNERLYNELKSDGNIKRSTTIKLNKSGGVVVRTDKQKQQLRNNAIRQYFYGLNNELSPHTQVIHWREIEIYRLGGGYIAPNTALPIGGKRLIDHNKLTRIYPSNELLHSIMAISYTSAVDQLVQSNVAGYVYCSAVDMNKKTVTLLTPAPGQLPSKLLLYGTVKWLDTT